MNRDPERHQDASRRAAPDLDEATRFTSLEDVEGSDEHDFELAEPNSGEAGPLGLLGEYLLLEQVGSGGMGQVFRAEHRTMNRQVAVKILSKNLASSRSLIEQFFAEIRAVAKLMHPNIVTAFDAGCVGNTHFLVMELVEGEVLSSRIRRQGPLTCAESVHVLEQAARALQYAHSLGIVHRDIKPSNMMLTRDGTLKILDFGLAHLGTTATTESNANIFMGTPEYMSPEQIEHADRVDGRSDLYSLGATLFYLLTGQAMFSGDKMQVALAQIRQKPPALFLARSDIDLRLDAIFQRLVEKQPANRFPSASALLENLRAASLTGSPVTALPLAKGVGRLGDSPTSVALSRSTLSKRSQIVALDLGTLVSTAAYYDPIQGPQLLHQGEGNANHLRNMIWSSSDQIKFGSAASALRQQSPQAMLHSIQRWIGAKHLPQKLCDTQVPPEVALASMLRQMMLNAAAATDQAMTAVVTVPGCYDQIHRRAIRDACRIAGIDLLQLLDKPLAGALSWLDVQQRLQTAGPASAPQSSLLLSLHLGGSGLEASVLRARSKQVELLGVHGSWKLGSLRWQSLLAEYFAGVLKTETGQDIRDDVLAATRLQRSVEMAMDRLTRVNKVEMRFDWSSASIRQTITQQGLVKIAPAMVSAIERAVLAACRAAEVEPQAINQLLVSGAMLRMPPIQTVVRSLLPAKVPMHVLDKADFARGAAIHAHHLAGLTQAAAQERLAAVGRTSYDFGLLVSASERRQSKPHIVMAKSTVLPAACTRALRPPAGSTTAAAAFPPFKLIESTSQGGSDWHLLADVQPAKHFPDYDGGQPLQLRFEVDESGLLQPSLLWPKGNRQSLIPICSESALSDIEISKWSRWLDTILLCSTQ